MVKPSKSKTAPAGANKTTAASSSKTARGRKAAIEARKSTTYSSPSRSPSPPVQPFRFFDLPSELRVRIYEEVLHVPHALDLHQLNYRLLRPRMNLLFVSRQVHHEAHSVFYAQTVRVFPEDGRFFNTKKPLLTRLPPRYRGAIRSLELSLGIGWHKPPKCQNTGPTLGLQDCVRVKTLHIFIRIDPSDSTFNGYRGLGATEETYQLFCLELLEGVIEQVPSLKVVEIDAFSAVKKDAPLVLALRRRIEAVGLKLTWGSFGVEEMEGDKPSFTGLEAAMAGMGLGGPASEATSVPVPAELGRVLTIQA